MTSAIAETVTLTTDASGDVTAYTAHSYHGTVATVVYGGQFDATADITVTTKTTAQSVWVETDVPKAAKTLSPRQPTHDTAGAALLYAAAGEAVMDRIYVCHEPLKLVVAQGGNAVTGTITVIIEGGIG